MIPAVRLEITPDVIEVDAPAGYDLERIGAEMDALWPALVRAVGPDLPPADTWPEHLADAFAERVAICAEAGVADPEAVALADLRLMYWRELCEMRQEMLEQVSASAA